MRIERPVPAAGEDGYGAAMFVVVRHGNTFEAGEPARRIGARTDLPLTAAGIAQGRVLGARFAALGWNFARVLVSPLARARQTAEAILEGLPSAPRLEDCAWLTEIDHGVDEDQPEAAIVARVGRAALQAWDARGEPPPGWVVDADRRLAGWRALFAAPPAGATLIVTSNGAARFALLADPALAAASRCLATMKLLTGGYGVIRRGDDGALYLPAWGERP